MSVLQTSNTYYITRGFSNFHPEVCDDDDDDDDDNDEYAPILSSNFIHKFY